MRLRTSVIMVALTLFAAASTATAMIPWQPKPKADVISGAWDAVLITDQGDILGIVTATDLVRILARNRGMMGG